MGDRLMARNTTPAPAGPLILGQDKRPQFAYPHRISDVAAVQAMAMGTATSDQQIEGMRWIVETACMTYDETFHPDSERASAFMQGRRFVGLKLILMFKVSLAKLRERQNLNAASEQGD